LAEQSGLIEPLSRWVLDTALPQIHQWKRDGHTIPVSVNMSMRNLHNPRLPDTISDLLYAWELTPDWLVLEITESAIMASPERALDVLARLSAMATSERCPSTSSRSTSHS
jgi:EAL domain-containing protein (putative c-di-GMP-specific phosphodiesterase class I)